MPTVSVVVPTYNRGERLAQTIESVLNQRYRDLELVVVDDASTDDTEETVREFDDSRVRYVSHRTNRGGAAARNTGIDASDGTYVAFLDDDDEWHPEKLERQVARLEESSDEWVAAYCDVRVRRHGSWKALRSAVADAVFDETGASQKPEGGSELIPVVLSMDLSLGGASTLVAERAVVEEIGGFDSDFQRHQDWEFLIRLLRAGKLAYVDETLVTKHESSQPSARTLEAAKGKLFDKFSNEIREAESRGYPVTGIHRFALARSHLVEGNFLSGVRYLSGAEVDPLRLCIAASTGLRTRVR